MAGSLLTSTLTGRLTWSIVPWPVAILLGLVVFLTVAAIILTWGDDLALRMRRIGNEPPPPPQSEPTPLIQLGSGSSGNTIRGNRVYGGSRPLVGGSELRDNTISDNETFTNEALETLATGQFTDVSGEHSARGVRDVTALDIQGSAIIRPGTRSTAEGSGRVTGTRIGGGPTEPPAPSSGVTGSGSMGVGLICPRCGSVSGFTVTATLGGSADPPTCSSCGTRMVTDDDAPSLMSNARCSQCGSISGMTRESACPDCGGAWIPNS
jgi:hypothetical protein